MLRLLTRIIAIGFVAVVLLIFTLGASVSGYFFYRLSPFENCSISTPTGIAPLFWCGTCTKKGFCIWF